VSWEDFIEDYRWLVDGGVHPLLACEVIGIKPKTAEKKLYRSGEFVLANQLSSAQTGKGWDDA
jgi:hypothetical protein